MRHFRARLVFAAFLSLFVGSASLAGEGKIYWAPQFCADFCFSSAIRSANLDGSEPQWVADEMGSVVVRGLALDTENGPLYWTQEAHAEYFQSRGLARGADWGCATILQSEFPVDQFGKLELDSQAGRVYWANGRKIERANVDGSARTEIYTAQNHARLTLDVARGEVYVSEKDNGIDGWKITRVSVDGGAGTVIYAGSTEISDLAVDSAGGKLYWVESTDNFATIRIQRSDLDGSNAEVVVAGILPTYRPVLAVDPVHGKIYWTADEPGLGGFIFRSDLDGANVERVVWMVRATEQLIVDPLGAASFETIPCAFLGVPAAGATGLIAAGLALLAGLTAWRMRSPRPS